ncbi:MAG: hypothetical protein RR840_08035 [Clostridium sp.]
MKDIGNRSFIKILIIGIVALGVVAYSKYTGDKTGIEKVNLQNDIVASCNQLEKKNISEFKIAKEKALDDILFVSYTFQNGDGWNYLGGATYKIQENGTLLRVGNTLNQFKDNNNISATELVVTKDNTYTIFFGKNANGNTQKAIVESTKDSKVTLEGKGEYFIEAYPAKKK